jgi:hypothetical protein
LDFKDNLSKLKSFFNVETNRDLAEKLNITEGAISIWGNRGVIPKKYLQKLENNRINTNSGTVQINGNNHGHININSSDEMSMEICKEIKKLSDKKKEYYYHLIKADVLKEQIG